MGWQIVQECTQIVFKWSCSWATQGHLINSHGNKMTLRKDCFSSSLTEMCYCHVPLSMCCNCNVWNHPSDKWLFLMKHTETHQNRMRHTVWSKPTVWLQPCFCHLHNSISRVITFRELTTKKYQHDIAWTFLNSLCQLTVIGFNVDQHVSSIQCVWLCVSMDLYIITSTLFHSFPHMAFSPDVTGQKPDIRIRVRMAFNQIL